ncbi:MAG: hypothetical protein H7249_09990 [Chitinophagaceae bacterium]|nr:hypothetical protein [Oligoflexus sp.]
MLKTARSAKAKRIRVHKSKTETPKAQKNKASATLYLNVCFGIGLILAFGSDVMAMPFKIDMNAFSRASQATVEMSDETGKSLTVVPIAAQLTIDFPAQGLYFLQIKSGPKILWREQLFILLKKPADDELMKTSWKVRAATMRTVLRVQDPAGTLRYGISIRDKIFLRLKAVPRLIRVAQEDYSGVSSGSVDLKVAPVSEKQAHEENSALVAEAQVEPLSDAASSDDDQTVYEPDYKSLLAGKEDKSLRQKIIDLGGAKRLAPLNRSSSVYGWLRIMQEWFTIRRTPDTFNGEKTQGFGTGLGGNLVFKDTMSLQLEIDTHGTKTEYQKGGLNTPSADQKRIHGRFGPLLDVLNIEHNHPQYALEVGPVIGYTMAPVQKDNESNTDFGGSIRFQYFGLAQTQVQVRFMKSHSRDIDVMWIGSAYKLASVSPLFALYNYHTEFDEAEARSEFNESGVRFGIARDF